MLADFLFNFDRGVLKSSTIIVKDLSVLLEVLSVFISCSLKLLLFAKNRVQFLYPLGGCISLSLCSDLLYP